MPAAAKKPKQAQPESDHQIVLMDLEKIQGAELNPKRHDIEALVRSITRFGFVAPAIIDESTGRLIAGHGRVEAVRKIQERGGNPPSGVQVREGAWLLPVIGGLSFSKEEAEAYILADNRLSEIGGWDYSELNTLLSQLKTIDFDISDIGYTEADLRAVEVSALPGPPIEGTPVEGPVTDEWAGMPEFDVQEKGPKRQLIISFANEEDVQLFARAIGQPITDRTRSLWFPKAEIASVVNRRYKAV